MVIAYSLLLLLIRCHLIVRDWSYAAPAQIQKDTDVRAFSYDTRINAGEKQIA